MSQVTYKRAYELIMIALRPVWIIQHTYTLTYAQSDFLSTFIFLLFIDLYLIYLSMYSCMYFFT